MPDPIPATAAGFRWAVVAVFACVAGAAAQGPGPAPVYVAAAVEKVRPASVRLVGDVEPIRRSVLAARIEGAVVAFPKREGERVSRGDVLAELDPTVVELELAAAEAVLDARRRQVAELEAETQPLVDAATAMKRSAAAQQQLAKRTMARAEELQRRQAMTVEDLDTARANLDAAEGRLQAAEADLRRLTGGARVERVARAKADVAEQTAVVGRLKQQRQYHGIHAPFDGYLVAENTQVGEWIEQGGPVAEVVDLSEVFVRVPVPGRYAGKVTVGQTLDLTVAADGVKLVAGAVDQVIPQLDPQSRMFPVKLRVRNDTEGAPLLRAGMLAELQLAVGDERPGVYVPKDALVFGGELPVVYVVVQAPTDEGPPTVRPAQVLLGSADGATIEVRGGVSVGDLVVVTGNERLRPGQPVQVVEQSSETPAAR